MLYGSKTRIEDYLVDVLNKGPMTGPRIVTTVEKNWALGVTKQAVYKALRKLTEEEVINKHGGLFRLNRVWLQKVYEFAQHHLKGSEIQDPMRILEFEDGDSVTYRFKSPYLLDITWGHLYDIIFEANEKHRVMLNHHPHEWLMISRTETEKYWLSQINKQEKMMLFTIGGSTNLDKKFKKQWSSDYIKINTGESYGLKPNQYLSVVGDYVFEITTDPDFEKRVHQFFIENEAINAKAKEEINKLSREKYKSKIKLSKNKRKADRWRTRYKRDFYIPKGYYL